MFTVSLPDKMVLVNRENGAIVLFDYEVVAITFTMSNDVARYNKLLGAQASVTLAISQPVQDDPFNSYDLTLDVVICEDMEAAHKVSSSIRDTLAPYDIVEGWVDEEPWSSSDYAAAGDISFDVDNDILF